MYCGWELGWVGSLCEKRLTCFESPTYAKAGSIQSFLSTCSEAGTGERDGVRFVSCPQSNIIRWSQNSPPRNTVSRGQNKSFKDGCHLQKMVQEEIVLPDP